MTGAEFRAARERLGLTYSELGVILGGIRADTIRRKWEIDKPGPSPMACQAVRWMLGGYRPPEWPDRLKKTGLKPGRVRCMDCRCNGDGSCPGETPDQQAAWRDQMSRGMR